MTRPNPPLPRAPRAPIAPDDERWCAMASLMQECLDASVDSFLGAGDPPLTRVGHVKPPADARRVVLHFGGDHLEGELSFSGTGQPFDLDDETLFLDWTGELLNQLAGRLNRALSLRGVNIHVSPPVVGDALAVPDAVVIDSRTFQGRRTSLRLDCGLTHVHLLPGTVPAEEALPEGTVLFF